MDGLRLGGQGVYDLAHKVEAQARNTPLRILVDPGDVAVSVVGAVTHLRLATGTVVLVDGGLHLQ